MFPAPPPSYSITTIKSPPLLFLNGVPCIWYKCMNKNKNIKGIIIYFHANSVDLGLIRKQVFKLGAQASCHIIAVEYPGYGIHRGSANSESCLIEAKRVLLNINNQFPNHKIFIVGRSIGTGIAAQLTSELNLSHPNLISKLILISPFASIEELAPTDDILSYFTSNIFNTQINVTKFNIPLLIIHGRLDIKVPLYHAKNILNNSISEEKHLHILQNSDHNNLNWHEINTIISQFL